MSSLLDTGTDTDDQTPVRSRHLPARLEFKESNPERSLVLPPPIGNLNSIKDSYKKPNRAKEALTKDEQNIVISKIESENRDEKMKSDDAPQKHHNRSKGKRNVVEILANSQSTTVDVSTVGMANQSTMSNTDTENEYTRPKLLVIPTTDNETDTDMFGQEKNLIKDLARLKGNARRSVDVPVKSKQKVTQARHSLAGDGQTFEHVTACPYSLAEIVWARVGAHPW